MSGKAVTSTCLDVHDLACQLDRPIRNLLSVLSMEMAWDEPVNGVARPVAQRHIAVVAQWWAGPCLQGTYTVFGAVKVMLWRKFQGGVYLEVVTDCYLPHSALADLCQGLRAATGLAVSHRGRGEEPRWLRQREQPAGGPGVDNACGPPLA